MTLAHDAVATSKGRELEPVDWSWGPRDAILYALGVGARPDRHLSLLFERAGPVVAPGFGTVPTGIGFLPMVHELGLSVHRVLHGEQSVEWHRPLTPTGRAVVHRHVAEVWDKGTAALLVLEERVDDGAPLLTARSTWFVAGGGGFGGARGPGVSVEMPPDRAPDVQRVVPVRPEQAALYRLSGDLNPIHIDPATAQAAGYAEPFLHGLCTFGIAALVMFDDVCESDPGRMEALQARFTAPVLPGDEVVVELWRTGEAVHVQCRVDDRIVLAGGQGRVRSSSGQPEVTGQLE